MPVSGYDIKYDIMQNNSPYCVKKYPPHSNERGGYFFIFGQDLN